jgi:hypothetical protein
LEGAAFFFIRRAVKQRFARIAHANSSALIPGGPAIGGRETFPIQGMRGLNGRRLPIAGQGAWFGHEGVFAMTKISAPDLAQRPPRSPRVRLGGYAHLPRLLDKARAFAAGKQGEYEYNCPLDGQFFQFTGIGQKAFLAAVKTGKSDTQMLAWVNARAKRLPPEILQWSSWMEGRCPGGAEGHGRFQQAVSKLAPERTDIATFFERLDLDDFVSFGGRG